MEEIKEQILTQIKRELNSINAHSYDTELIQSEIIKNLSVSYKILSNEMKGINIWKI